MLLNPSMIKMLAKQIVGHRLLDLFSGHLACNLSMVSTAPALNYGISQPLVFQNPWQSHVLVAEKNTVVVISLKTHEKYLRCSFPDRKTPIWFNQCSQVRISFGQTAFHSFITFSSVSFYICAFIYVIYHWFWSKKSTGGFGTSYYSLSFRDWSSRLDNVESWSVAWSWQWLSRPFATISTCRCEITTCGWFVVAFFTIWWEIWLVFDHVRIKISFLSLNSNFVHDKTIMNVRVYTRITLYSIINNKKWVFFVLFTSNVEKRRSTLYSFLKNTIRALCKALISRLIKKGFTLDPKICYVWFLWILMYCISSMHFTFSH